MEDTLLNIEIKERERLLELQKSRIRWFSQKEFDRLIYLTNRIFIGTGSSYNKE